MNLIFMESGSSDFRKTEKSFSSNGRHQLVQKHVCLTATVKCKLQKQQFPASNFLTTKIISIFVTVFSAASFLDLFFCCLFFTHEQQCILTRTTMRISRKQWIVFYGSWRKILISHSYTGNAWLIFLVGNNVSDLFIVLTLCYTKKKS